MTPPEDAATAPPSPRRPPTLARRAVDLLVSPKLAIALLLVVLACCLVGVTVVRGAEAGELIFATLWFNALLVLLAVSSGAAFFSRFWRRKRTLVSVGMIVFHLSFMGVLGGVVYNSLFAFQGVLRLSEGETLPNDRLENYDEFTAGRFFDPARLRGETTLVRLLRNYQVDGEMKRVAYEIEVGRPGAKERRVIYITEYFDHDGVRYFRLKEGYTVLLVLSDAAGRELYGAHVPLQSLQQRDGSFLYASGTSAEAHAFAFPPPPEAPRLELEVTYWPGLVERTGQVSLEATPAGVPLVQALKQKRLVPVGGQLEVGGLVIAAREIRYWVGLHVRYDPGLNLILGSLCIGLGGMVLTFIGRVRQASAKKRVA